MHEIVKLAPTDPIFALCPDLPVHRDASDGELIANSHDVAQYFDVPHDLVLKDICGALVASSWTKSRIWFRDRGGSYDLTSDALSFIVGPWPGDRARKFTQDWIDVFMAAKSKIEAETGRDLIAELFGQFGFVKLASSDGRHLYGLPHAEDGAERERCCDDCWQPAPAGPMLHDDLWATIAKPNGLLCLPCTERRLGRRLTQADLTICPFNAGWIPVSRFTGDDAVVAAQFAEGRHPLPFEVIKPPPAT